MSSIKSQNIIDVGENTMKVSAASEVIFYYGFAEGDKVIINLNEVNGKDLKEFEISLLNGNPVFMEYKTSKVSEKILHIPKTGIYKFRLANSNILSPRICKIKVQRIPENENSIEFNTTVYNRKVFDTIQTIHEERFLVKSDTTITEIESKTLKINSIMNANGNKQSVIFQIPENTISWSYYIGINQEGQKAYDDATKQLLSKSAPLLKGLVGSTPLGALALGLPSFLNQIQGGEDVTYFLIDADQKNAFDASHQFRYYKSGKIVNTFSRVSERSWPKNLAFCFENDNKITPIEVLLKITTVQVNEVWENRQVKRNNVVERTEMYLKN
jgi:hypothetical protein